MVALRHCREVSSGVVDALTTAVVYGVVCVAALVTVGAATTTPALASAAGVQGLDWEPPAAARSGSSGRVSDVQHVLQVVAWKRSHLSKRPLVYYFGGSATRESVFSEAAWSSQLSARAQERVVAWVMASKCQSFADDLRVVRQLPAGHGLALISVGIGRFMATHKPRTVSSTSTRSSPPGPWFQHHYDGRGRYSDARKRSLARLWLAERYPLFKARCSPRLDDLERLIAACRDRGLRVALVEMPTNQRILGSSFDKVRSRYQRGCTALAQKYGLDYVRFCSKLGLRSADYYDLAHLLPSGRAKWQARLSREIVNRDLLAPLPAADL